MHKGGSVEGVLTSPSPSSHPVLTLQLILFQAVEKPRIIHQWHRDGILPSAAKEQPCHELTEYEIC